MFDEGGNWYIVLHINILNGKEVLTVLALYHTDRSCCVCFVFCLFVCFGENGFFFLALRLKHSHLFGFLPRARWRL